MTYISLNYYIMVVLILVAYYLLPLKHRWIALLVGSVSFYYFFWQEGWLIFLITILTTYMLGLGISKLQNGKRKLVTGLGIFIVASIWFCAKVSNFFLEDIFSTKPIKWIVPLGISFYTLQLISYLVDIYREEIEPERNILKFALFVSYFPQLIQGPIPRFKQLQSQLIEGHKFDERRFLKGFCYVIWGFFLKMVIADKAGVLVDTVFDEYPIYSGIYIWIASILYSLQLYTDFLACTTLAQGVSGMFGIELLDNFARPYFADSIKDFWRRWHISLSTWLKDYIYIPLGGNRHGKFRKYINLIVTFTISGLWHGSGLKFVAWGLLHAMYQILGEILMPARNRIAQFFVGVDASCLKRIRLIITFLLVNWAWILFRADTLTTGLKMIKHMLLDFNPWILTNGNIFTLGLDSADLLVLCIGVVVLYFVGKTHEDGKSVSDVVLAYPTAIRFLIYIVSIVAIILVGTYGFGYNAQDFIYGGF